MNPASHSATTDSSVYAQALAITSKLQKGGAKENGKRYLSELGEIDAISEKEISSSYSHTSSRPTSTRSSYKRNYLNLETEKASTVTIVPEQEYRKKLSVRTSKDRSAGNLTGHTARSCMVGRQSGNSRPDKPDVHRRRFRRRRHQKIRHIDRQNTRGGLTPDSRERVDSQQQLAQQETDEKSMQHTECKTTIHQRSLLFSSLANVVSDDPDIGAGQPCSLTNKLVQLSEPHQRVVQLSEPHQRVVQLSEPHQRVVHQTSMHLSGERKFLQQGRDLTRGNQSLLDSYGHQTLDNCGHQQLDSDSSPFQTQGNNLLCLDRADLSQQRNGEYRSENSLGRYDLDNDHSAQLVVSDNSTGKRSDVKMFGAVPSNVHQSNSAPQSDVRADRSDTFEWNTLSSESHQNRDDNMWQSLPYIPSSALSTFQSAGVSSASSMQASSCLPDAERYHISSVQIGSSSSISPTSDYLSKGMTSWDPTNSYHTCTKQSLITLPTVSPNTSNSYGKRHGSNSFSAAAPTNSEQNIKEVSNPCRLPESFPVSWIQSSGSPDSETLTNAFDIRVTGIVSQTSGIYSRQTGTSSGTVLVDKVRAAVTVAAAAVTTQTVTTTQAVSSSVPWLKVTVPWVKVTKQNESFHVQDQRLNSTNHQSQMSEVRSHQTVRQGCATVSEVVQLSNTSSDIIGQAYQSPTSTDFLWNNPIQTYNAVNSSASSRPVSFTNRESSRAEVLTDSGRSVTSSICYADNCFTTSVFRSSQPNKYEFTQAQNETSSCCYGSLADSHKILAYDSVNSHPSIYRSGVNSDQENHTNYTNIYGSKNAVHKPPSLSKTDICTLVDSSYGYYSNSAQESPAIRFNSCAAIDSRVHTMPRFGDSKSYPAPSFVLPPTTVSHTKTLSSNLSSVTSSMTFHIPRTINRSWNCHPESSLSSATNSSYLSRPVCQERWSSSVNPGKTPDRGHSQNYLPNANLFGIISQSQNVTSYVYPCSVDHASSNYGSSRSSASTYSTISGLAGPNSNHKINIVSIAPANQYSGTGNVASARFSSANTSIVDSSKHSIPSLMTIHQNSLRQPVVQNNAIFHPGSLITGNIQISPPWQFIRPPPPSSQSILSSMNVIPRMSPNIFPPILSLFPRVELLPQGFAQVACQRMGNICGNMNASVIPGATPIVSYGNHSGLSVDSIGTPLLSAISNPSRLSGSTLTYFPVQNVNLLRAPGQDIAWQQCFGQRFQSSMTPVTYAI